MRLSLVGLLVGSVSAFTVQRSSSIPTTQLRAADFASLASIDASPETLAAAGAAAVGIAGIALSGGSNGSTAATSSSSAKAAPEQPKADVSIPYNAAALLAYEDIFVGQPFDASKFAKFEELYETKVVAEVTLKKVARDQEAVLNGYRKVIEKAESDMAGL